MARGATAEERSLHLIKAAFRFRQRVLSESYSPVTLTSNPERAAELRAEQRQRLLQIATSPGIAAGSWRPY